MLRCVRRRVFDRVYRWEFLALKAFRYEVYEDMERSAGHDVDEESVQASVYSERSNRTTLSTHGLAQDDLRCYLVKAVKDKTVPPQSYSNRIVTKR